jgi:Uma2 family endonuclease
MTLAPPAPNPDDLAPLLLPDGLRLSPEQFGAVCSANHKAVLKLTAEGHLIQTTPTGGETGARNSRLLMRLLAWADNVVGWQVFDSSTGFLLPDGSVHSPDASLVGLERWRDLTTEQRRGFPPLCPDLLVQLASPSDDGPRGLTTLRRKMASYQANGAGLGWLLIPEQQAVEIWSSEASGEPLRLEGATTLECDERFPGLRLELAEIWEV